MSKIKVNSIEAATGTTITIPSGQTLDISSTTLTLPSTVVTTTDTQTLTNKTIGVSQLTGTLPTSKGGTGLSSIGTAGQALKVNSGATALEFGTISSKIGAISAGYLKDKYAYGTLNTYLDIGLSATITPTAAGSSILALVSVSSGANAGTAAGHHYALYRNVNSGGDTKIDYFTGNVRGGSANNRGIFSGSSEAGSEWTQESSASSVLDNSTAGLSYTLGNSIVYKVYGFTSGTAVVNSSYRDDAGTDDTRTMSSLILIEVLA